MNLRKAAEMALEIIEGEWPADDEIASPVMYALREALAKPEQEPVAYRTVNNVGAYVYHSADRLPNEYGLRGEALYLHPAPIPEGWQLVPKEPTPEMIEAASGYAASTVNSGKRPTIAGYYVAMLDVAPKPEERNEIS